MSSETNPDMSRVPTERHWTQLVCAEI